jgi:hypothetical protein
MGEQTPRLGDAFAVRGYQNGGRAGETAFQRRQREQQEGPVAAKRRAEQRLEADDYHTILPQTPFDLWFKRVRGIFSERHPEHVSTWNPTIIKNLPAWFAWIDALEPGDV